MSKTKIIVFGLLAGVFAVFMLSCGNDNSPTGGGNSTVINCPTPTSGPTEHSGTLGSNEVWTADAGPHIITGNITIKNDDTLTIEPCATVQIAAGATISVGVVGSAGHLIAVGDSTHPITITSRDTDPWKNIQVIYPGTATLAYVGISNGGSDLITYDGATLVMQGGNMDTLLTSIVKVNNVIISNSAGYGIMIKKAAGFIDGSENLVVIGSGSSDPDTSHGYPVAMEAISAGTLPSGAYTGNGIDAISLPFVQNALKTDVTFYDRGVPYHLLKNMTIGEGASTTVQPGVDFLMGEDVGITVGPFQQQGSLTAIGTTTAPITFKALDALPWSLILVKYPATASFANVTLEGGGGNSITYDGASLAMLGDGNLPVKKMVAVNDVTVSNSAGYGVLARELGGFDDASSGLTITGSGALSASNPSSYAGLEYPVRIEAQAMGTLPSGQYTGNVIDEIHINPIKAIKADVTVMDVGVPYNIDGTSATSIHVYQQSLADPVPTLTLQAGVVFKVDAGMSLKIGSSGLLGAFQALGTVSNPIVITSAETVPSAGDWVGIYFDDQPGTAINKIDYTRIEYAGFDCLCGGYSCEWAAGYKDNAAILMLGWKPNSSFVTNTTISYSAGHGINRGWDASSPDLDFTVSNTFTNITYCDQTTPIPLNGSCPSVSCP